MISKKYFQFLIFALLLGFASLTFLAQAGDKPGAQEELGIYIIRTESGYLVVHNRQTKSYSIEFKGEKFKPIKGDHPTFVIDGKLVQVVSVRQENYWKTKKDLQKEPTDNELLETHKMWESDYLGNELGYKLSVKSEIFEIERKRKVMFWSFPMPKELNADYSHQIFLTTLINKDILGLNASPTKDDEQKPYREYLIESMNTLKISEKPFNIKQLRALLQKAETAE